MSGRVGIRIGAVSKWAWSGFVTVSLLVAWLSVVDMPSRDSSAFIYIAQGMMQGELPYVDRWDHKPPLIYLIDLVGLQVSGGALWGIWLIEAVWLAGVVLLATGVLRRVFGVVPAAFAVVAVLLYLPRLLEGGNLTEEYALLFQFAGLYLFTRIEDTRRGVPGYAALLGLCALAAFLLKPNLVGVWVAIGVYWIVGRGASLGKIAYACVGAALGGLLFLAGLLLSGTFQAFVDAVFTYNLAYAEMSDPAQRLQVVAYALEHMPLFQLAAVVWISTLVYLFVRGPSAARLSPLLGLALLLLPVEWLLVSTSGRTYGHYYLALLPVTAIFLAHLAAVAETGIRRLAARPGVRLTPDSLGSIVFFVPLLLIVADERSALSSTVDRMRQHLDAGHVIRGPWQEVSAYLQREHGTGGAVLVWGAQAQIHVLSGRPAPSRFFYQYPLVTPGYSSRQLIDEFLDALTRHPPPTIVDTANPYLPPLNMQARAAWHRNRENRYGYDQAGFEKILAYIDANYRQAGEIAGYAIYRRRDIGG